MGFHKWSLQVFEVFKENGCPWDTEKALERESFERDCKGNRTKSEEKSASEPRVEPPKSFQARGTLKRNKQCKTN